MKHYRCSKCGERFHDPDWRISGVNQHGTKNVCEDCVKESRIEHKYILPKVDGVCVDTRHQCPGCHRWYCTSQRVPGRKYVPYYEVEERSIRLKRPVEFRNHCIRCYDERPWTILYFMIALQCDTPVVEVIIRAMYSDS